MIHCFTGREMGRVKGKKAGEEGKPLSVIEKSISGAVKLKFR